MRLKLVAIVVLLVVGAAAFVATVGGFPRSAAAATSFLTSTATIGDVRDDVAATGSIASAASWNLTFGAAPTVTPASDDASSPATPTGTWVVRTVKAKVGDSVRKGEVIASATNTELTARIAAAKNDWTVASLNDDQAQAAYDDATTDDAIRQTRIGLLNARNQLATAHQTLLDLRAEAARNRLVSPAAGVVTALNVSAGAVAPSGAAVTIATNDFEVTANVVESDIATMKLQQPATVTVAAIGATLDGTVTAIAPTAESSSGNSSVVSYAVTVALENPPATLRAGMTADVTITTASATSVLAVPAAAVRGIAGNYSVLVMGATGTPEARPVKVGLMTSSLVEIQSGLSEGDVVVTGTSSNQRSSTTNGFGGPGGNGGFVVPGGGRGGNTIVQTKP
jgi:macrolide-specific efflux system membrane fusion protein